MAEKGASSPAPGGFTTLEEEIAYYKSQYEQLEVELQEFQASSKELEAELERDVEASEKRERSLKEKLEALRYEVDEWKAKYKQSKTEANTAQSTLQKEITSLRDTNRTLQFKLRDIEVANDDYERQARNTTSSLEDLESKYNVTLERGVMLEEEIRNGEQEREALRIEAQRLKEELSDLKVEAEITQEKLRSAEAHGVLRPNRISTLSDPRSNEPRSPASDGSFPTVSTPTTTPPPAKSEGSTAASETTPPSPPLSDPAAAPIKAATKRTAAKRPSTALNSNTTPRPSNFTSNGVHRRGPSLAPPNGATPSFRKPAAKPIAPEPLPRSGSLYQIRGLIGKMQKLEERVHSVKSKLPAPTTTPPRASPRGTTSTASHVPPTVTVRSSKKQASTSSYQTPSREESSSRLGHRQSRMSFGGPSAGDTTPSRPSSRASNASNTSNHGFARPGSRASLIGGRMTAGTHHVGSAAESRRPRSSLSGTFAQSYSAHASTQGSQADENSGGEFATPTARRTTLDRNGIVGSGIPTPSGKGFSSSVIGRGPPRRQSIRAAATGTTPRPASQMEQRQSSEELGETF